MIGEYVVNSCTGVSECVELMIMMEVEVDFVWAKCLRFTRFFYYSMSNDRRSR